MVRSKVQDEITIRRFITNEYGTTAEHLQFEYGLIKCGKNTSFTRDEQRIIETWLTSPKFSSELQILDEYGYVRYKFLGLFTNTNWYFDGDDTFVGCSFTFDVNGRYPYEHYNHVFTTNNNTVNGQTIETVIDCKSDELEEYIYPTIKVKPLDYSANVSFLIRNNTENKQMEVDSGTRSSSLLIDCDKCITCWDGNYDSIATFEDLGWEDVGEIYWLRLFPGENSITIQSEANLEFTISYDAPIKKVGGWLI